MGKGALEDLVASQTNVQNVQCVCSCVCVEEVRGEESSWVQEKPFSIVGQIPPSPHDCILQLDACNIRTWRCRCVRLREAQKEGLEVQTLAFPVL